MRSNPATSAKAGTSAQVCNRQQSLHTKAQHYIHPPSKRMCGRSSSIRFQQPRYWVRTSAAFCSGVLVKKASLQSRPRE